MEKKARIMMKGSLDITADTCRKLQEIGFNNDGIRNLADLSQLIETTALSGKSELILEQFLESDDVEELQNKGFNVKTFVTNGLLFRGKTVIKW